MYLLDPHWNSNTILDHLRPTRTPPNPTGSFATLLYAPRYFGSSWTLPNHHWSFRILLSILDCLRRSWVANNMGSWTQIVASLHAGRSESLSMMQRSFGKDDDGAESKENSEKIPPGSWYRPALLAPCALDLNHAPRKQNWDRRHFF